ncbi:MULTISPECIES: hypothetical protein [Rhodanobacter]|uniref:hypothetical protein n=1 Tax=Rhodanobacter TaxID=75309 RepID=UPI0011144BAD|nr:MULTISPECIES: hypothetical protein [Rhodanobacter]
MTTDKSITLTDTYDLLALHKGLMESRFCDVPNDPGVSGSPRLADIHRNVIKAIRSADLPAGLSPESWDKWLVVDEDRREWRIALDRAVKSSRWQKMDYAEKCSLASNLLAPFYIDDEVLDKFVKAADANKY